MDIPARIKMRLTGNVLTRYDGPPFTLTIHRDHQGRPMTTASIKTGDYTCGNEHQTPEWLLANPNLWQPLG